MEWTYDNFWQKVKIYTDRALEEDRSGPLFPFWAALALEFIGRATLARVHPALLADPQQQDSFMYAFNLGTAKNPRSILAKTVFSRCIIVVEDFTEEDFNFVISLMERRNRELHSGIPAFEDLATDGWLANYFCICAKLLKAQRKSLEDWLGTEEAAAAEEMIKACVDAASKNARKLMGSAKQMFDAKAAEEREVVGIEGAKRAQMYCEQKWASSKIISCPSCQSGAVLEGERVRASEPKLTNEKIVRHLSILPTRLRCFVCGLELRGQPMLYGAGFAGQFTIKEEQDPVEYFKIDPYDYIDPADFIDDDYGNE